MVESSRSLPNERDLAPVGRPRRPGIFGRIAREPTHVRGPHERDVHVPVVLLRPVPGERHLLAIRREGRIQLRTRQRRERQRCASAPVPRDGGAKAAAAMPLCPRSRAQPQLALRSVRDELRTTGARAVTPDSDSSLMSSSATFTSSMCWNRRCGSLRRHRRITFSRSLGTVGDDGAGTSWVARESPHSACRPWTCPQTRAPRSPSRRAARRS